MSSFLHEELAGAGVIEGIDVLAKVSELLRRADYQVVFRSNAWVECLVQRSAECWVGYGESEQKALDDVLRQMFPSRLARVQLARRLATAHTPESGSSAGSRRPVPQ